MPVYSTGDGASQYPKINLTNADGTPFTGGASSPVLTKYIAPSITMYATGVAASITGGNTAMFTSFYVPHTQLIDRVFFEVAVQNGNVDVGIYDDDGTAGAPATRLSSSGSTACPAVGGASIAVTEVSLTPGNYWAALASDSATASFRYGTGMLTVVGFITPRYSKTTSFPLPASIAAPTADVSGNVFMIRAGKS